MAHIPPPPPLPPVNRNNESILNSSTKNNEDTCLYDLNLFHKKTITSIEHVPQTGPK